MSADLLMIAVGLMVILWGAWWLPRQLMQIEERVTRQSRDRYDKLMMPVVRSRMRRISIIVGGVTVVIGAIYLIIEL
jgi:hypothetical protein